jgi:hypothetical protein
MRRALVTTIATATVTALGTVVSASAPGPSAGPVCDHLDGTTGCFYPAGDHFRVKDSKKDGWRPEVQWDAGYRHGICRWSGRHAVTDCNYNLREGSRIHFRLYLRNGHAFKTHGFRTATA